MQMTNSPATTLAAEILNRLESLVLNAEANARPLETEPQRGQLFELFVTAEAAGFLEEDAEPDLTADGLCAKLAERWGLKQAAQSWMHNQSQLPPEQLAKMRLLWSVMRMWMEWTYAWRRWPEFHQYASGE